MSAIFEPMEATELATVAARLVVAAALGGVLGFEREMMGKAAGLRTHMLVALGSALFVITPQQAGAGAADLTRVVQGIATGIGFVGAGVILKLTEQGEVKGLTTATSVWLAAALGMGVGAGRFWAPLIGAALALVILAFLRRFEAWDARRARGQ
jgi:putative Mg2+ transporter-C (MgtC) family protein